MNITSKLTFEEARSLRLHDLFEQFYAKHCETLGIPVDGPLAEPV